jgi:hypothetical protein
VEAVPVLEKLVSTHPGRNAARAHPKFGSNDLRTAEWKLAERIVASQSFARSTFLTNFLLYVCDRKLRGHEDEITEYQIGIQALGRPENYNPGEDNIVRNYARMLRKRLEDYFEDEGRDEPLRIVIPRGQYVPSFEPNSRTSLPIEIREISSPSSSASLVSPEKRLRRPRWIAASVLGVVLLATLLAWELHGPQGPSALFEVFWSQVFAPHRSSLVITGDSGFAMLQEMTGHEVHLHEYVTGDLDTQFSSLPLPTSPRVGSFGASRFSNYTSTADLRMIVGLSRLPEFQKAPTQVRYARDVHMDDVKQANVVLIGGPRANPWGELFETQSAFAMKVPVRLIQQHLDERIIVNKHPLSGELPEYSNVLGPEPYNTYTIVSFLRSIDGLGWALIVQGQNMAATEAGGDFVLNRDAMWPVLKKARRKDGSIGPFELVLETKTIGADAPQATLVVERYGP